MKQIKHMISVVLVLAILLGMAAMPASAISVSTEMVIDPVYEDAQRFVDGYAAVKINGKWGFINDNGEMVVAAKYDWAGIHHEGVAVVAKWGTFQTLDGTQTEAYLLYLVDMNGKETPLEDPFFDLEGDKTGPLYYTDLDEIEGSGAYWSCSEGVVNAGWYPYTKEGKPILPKNTEVLYKDGNYNHFSMVDSCIDGVIPMYGTCLFEAGTYQLFHMDAEGTITRTFPVTGLEGVEFNYVSAPNNGLTLVGTNVWDASVQEYFYYYGILNEDDEWVMPLAYPIIRSFIGGTFAEEGVIVACNEDYLYGMFDTNGDPIIPMEYESIDPFIRGRTTGVKDGQSYVLDAEGNAYPIAGLDGKVSKSELTITAYSTVGVAAVYNHDTGESYCISKNPVDGVIPVVKGSEVLGTNAYFADIDGDGSIDRTMPPNELIAVYQDGKWGYALLDVEHDNPFVDLKEGKFYVDAVLWAVYENITKGITATEFQPDKACTRSQIVTFIWRAMGCPEPQSTVNPFTDVDENAFYYKAVLWAVENKITAGLTATTFGPKEPCTRNQAVTFLWRAAGCPAPENTTHSFADVSETAYYRDAVLWAVENGITKGVSATEFAPKQECSRGHIVTFLYRNLVG